MPATVPQYPEDGIAAGLTGLSQVLSGVLRGKDAAEEKYRDTRNFNEDVRQFDTRLGEQARQFDLGSAQQQQQFDANLDERQFEFDANDRFQRLQLRSMEEQGLLDRESAAYLQRANMTGQLVEREMINRQSDIENRRNNATTQRGQDIGQDESRADRDARYAALRGDQRLQANLAHQWAQRKGLTSKDDLSPQERRELAAYMAEALGYSSDYLTGGGRRPAWDEQTRAEFEQRAVDAFRSADQIETEDTRQQQQAAEAGPLYQAQREAEILGAGADPSTSAGRAALRADSHYYDPRRFYNYGDTSTYDLRTGFPKVDPKSVVENNPYDGVGPEAVPALQDIEPVIDSLVLKHVGPDQLALTRATSGEEGNARKQFKSAVQADLYDRLLGPHANPALKRMPFEMRASLLAAYTEQAVRTWDYQQGLQATSAIGGVEEQWRDVFQNGGDFEKYERQLLLAQQANGAETPTSVLLPSELGNRQTTSQYKNPAAGSRPKPPAPAPVPSQAIEKPSVLNRMPATLVLDPLMQGVGYINDLGKPKPSGQ